MTTKSSGHSDSRFEFTI